MKFVIPAMFAILMIPLLAAAQASTPVSLCGDQGASDKTVILAICTEVHGMRGTSGPHLFLRLYADGRTAAENQDEADPALALKRSRASTAQLREVLRLGRAADFQKAKSAYPAYNRRTDSSSQTTVTFNDRGRVKRIVLANFYIHDPNNKKHYPASLNALMKLAEKMSDAAVKKVNLPS